MKEGGRGNVGRDKGVINAQAQRDKFLFLRRDLGHVVSGGPMSQQQWLMLLGLRCQLYAFGAAFDSVVSRERVLNFKLTP